MNSPWQAHARLVGQEQEVLVEGVSKRSPEELCGRLRTNQVVNFIGPRELLGMSDPGDHNRGAPPFSERPVGAASSTCRP